MCFVLYLSTTFHLLFKNWSALHKAAKNNNVEATKLLLKNGANVNAEDYDVSISIYYGFSMLHKFSMVVQP